MINFVIVGTGPAGMATAMALAGHRPHVFDIGLRSPEPAPTQSLGNLLRDGTIGQLLGPKLEMLQNLINTRSKHSKLRSRAASHIETGVPFEFNPSFPETGVTGRATHASGGQSIAWGGQLPRYTQNDLDRVGEWPIRITDLNHSYTALEQHIGISGLTDDLSEFFGPQNLQFPPPPLAPAAATLMKRYQASRHQSRLLLGRSRIGLRTTPSDNATQFLYNELDFHSTSQTGFYTAQTTLDHLITTNAIYYHSNRELKSWIEYNSHVALIFSDTVSGEEIKIDAKTVFLGCGVLQTSRLVLLQNDRTAKLPFIDHPPYLLPFFIPSALFQPLPDKSFPIQLAGSFRDDPSMMISFYYAGGMLFSDLLCEIPFFDIRSASQIAPLVARTMLVAQIWHDSKPQGGNYLQLDGNNHIHISYKSPETSAGLSDLCLQMARLGAFSHPALAKAAPAGWGFHYAATLPMRANPGQFQTSSNGRLWNSSRVYIVDGSVLPTLPSKNHSLTMMANAFRITSNAIKDRSSIL